MINKHNAKEYLPFLQALVEGKDVEFLTGNGEWVKNTNFSFSFPPERYRVKEPLLEAWANVYSKSVVYHQTKESALAGASVNLIKTVRLVEVRD